MNTLELEPFFSEPNKFGYRTLLPGKSSSSLIHFYQKTELVEFVSEIFDCDTRKALTAIFNKGFIRCANCAKPIVNSYSSESCTVKCGRQMSLKHLRETGKMENVRRKCSEITTKWWADMTDEQYAQICETILSETRKFLATLTPEEKQKRWLTNPNGYRPSLDEFYDNLPRERHLEMRRAIGKRMRKVDYEKLGEYTVYHHKVWEITNEVYFQNKETINPNNYKRGVGLGVHQLDHKYSISMGFKHDIPAEVIGSIHNLEMLTSSENASKNWRCSISEEQLMEAYNNGIR